MPPDDHEAASRHARRWADAAWAQGWHAHALEVLDHAIRMHLDCFKLFRKRGIFYLVCPDSTVRDEEQGAADLRRACELSGWREDLVQWVAGVLNEYGDPIRAKELLRLLAEQSKEE